MPDHHWNAVLAQPFDIVAVLKIGALDLVAEGRHHLGDAAHTDAADADEVNRAYIAR